MLQSIHWALVPNVYEENWSKAQCREIAEGVVHHINLDQTVKKRNSMFEPEDDYRMKQMSENRYL